MRSLNTSEIEFRISKTTSSEEALKDVTPVKWSEKIIHGKQKAVISFASFDNKTGTAEVKIDRVQI